MNISEVIQKMIEYSNGDLHDIDHFLKVYAYARTIAEGERLPQKEREITEIAAIVHDIACPLCREKYGNADGKHQETEGVVLAREFLKGLELSEDVIERVVYLVGHHHTYENVDGSDYRILLEADYLVNADESRYSRENIENAMKTIFKTQTGISLLKSVYRLG
ncbi:MAG: HD domain-containing protein [Bacteroides sp.]|nr:HD domain-containing protein [Eubacterium sp.]MCM1417870.1 HD domain-containing protein [Roseburia sp.]MCM1461309.1 HD domain-containing protein [Bacteroides sp.]